MLKVRLTDILSHLQAILWIQPRNLEVLMRAGILLKVILEVKGLPLPRAAILDPVSKKVCLKANQ